VVNTLAGLVLGVVLALIALVIRQLFASRVRSVAELQRFVDAPLLGEITADGSPDPAFALLRTTGSPTAESYRTLRASLAHEAADQGPVSILVTSTSESVDTAAISANLALAFSEAGNRVALVDADLRTPTLADTAGVDTEPGLVEILKSNIRHPRVVRKGAFGSVDLVPARAVENPTGILAKGNFSQMLTALRKDYDSIIVNTHATTTASDATVLAPFVDGVVVIADRASVQTSGLAGALTSLRRAGATITGIVLAERAPVSVRSVVARLFPERAAGQDAPYRVNTTSGESVPRSTVTVTESEASSATPNT
jgi:capsular exopolysaccharide synthesis family protein